jgi:hypothetical protein
VILEPVCATIPASKPSFSALFASSSKMWFRTSLWHT